MYFYRISAMASDQTVFLWNGVPTPYPVQGLSPLNRSFRYGDGLFETMRMINGRIPLIRGHHERLLRSMMTLNLSTVAIPDWQMLHDACEAIAVENRCLESARLRFSVYRESGEGYAPTTSHCGWALECAPTLDTAWQLNGQGLRLGTYTVVPKYRTPWSDIKSASAMLYVQAAQWAKHREFDEALLLNEDGEIAEALSSNVFLLQGNTLSTPVLQSGGLPGVMREIVLEIADVVGLDVQERVLFPNDLLTADEVFLTNAVQGIRWILAYERRRYFKKWSLTCTELLNEVLRAMPFPEEQPEQKLPVQDVDETL